MWLYHFSSTSIMKHFLVCCAALLLCVSCDNKPDSPISDYTTIDYFASPYDSEGTKNLLIREGSQAELYGIADTVKAELTDAEMQAIAKAMKAVAKWDTLYEATPSDRYEIIRRIDPQGIASIRRSHGSEAPAAVDELLKTLNSVATRLRAGAEKNNKAQ